MICKHKREGGLMRLRCHKSIVETMDDLVPLAETDPTDH